MIYVSTGGRCSHTAFETAKDFLDHGITSIELSGGIYSASYKKDLLSLSNKATFQVHNYFPPPLVPFVFNLASQNSDILKQSMGHARKAMELVSDLGGRVYSFHAGFRFDPKVSDLGKSLSANVLYKQLAQDAGRSPSGRQRYGAQRCTARLPAVGPVICGLR